MHLAQIEKKIHFSCKIPVSAANTLLMKCLCMHCSASLEFEPEYAEQTIDCPECAKQTTLYEPEVDKEKREKMEARVKAGKETIKVVKHNAKDAFDSTVDAGLSVAGFAMEGLAKTFEVIVTATVTIGMLFFSWEGGGAIGLLLAVLIIVTYSGLSEIRKEIRKLNR
jgi:hypothetical protein